MQCTIMLMNEQEVNSLVKEQGGVIKRTASGVNYIIIEE